MSVLILVLGLVAVFAGIVLVIVAAGAGVDERAAVGRSLASIEAIQTAPSDMRPANDQSFGDRVVTPAMARLTGYGRKLSGQDTSGTIKRKLDLAGSPAGWDSDRVLAFKAIGGLIGLVV